MVVLSKTEPRRASTSLPPGTTEPDRACDSPDRGRFIASPQIATNYQATWKGAYATSTSIQVQPKVTLGRNSGWIIHAAAGVSFDGKAVEFQGHNALTGQWATLKKVILNSKSSARVVYKLPKGLNRLRVTMSVNQAGAGFLGAISPTVKVRQL